MNSFRLRAVVHGRVQGVGFRHFVWREATQLGLSGAVSNRVDGAVEIQAHGGANAVATLLEKLHRGPVGSRVERVESTVDAAIDPGGEFRIVSPWTGDPMTQERQP